MKRLAGALLALLTVAFTPLTPMAQAQDQHPDLQKKLDGLYTLTKTTADKTDIVKAGSVLVLHKDGLQLCSTQARLGIPNVYKDGRLAASKAKWGFEMGVVQSDLPTASVPVKVFDTGDKIWVTGVSAEKSSLVVKVYTDAYDDVRYFGQIEIPYGKKGSGGSDEDLLKQLAEVVTVDAGGDAAATAPIPPPDGKPMQLAPVDPKEAIKAKLASMVVLTTGKLSTGEITKAGSIIELQKDGLDMWPTDSGTVPIYVYKNGKFSMPTSAWMQAHAALHAKDPDLNPSNVAKRRFVAGEKFWIIEYKVRDNGVFLTFVSDPYNDNVRYYGAIWFPFEKNQPIPTADAFVKSMGELITVEDAPAQEAAAAKPPAPAAPAAPAIAPIAPPPAPPKTLNLGQSRAEVLAILGQPPKMATVGKKEIYYYPDMKVILIDGKVSDIQ